jgi:zinc/manganese transport system substrate-binding protein
MPETGSSEILERRPCHLQQRRTIRATFSDFAIMSKGIALALWVAIWLLPHSAALAEQLRVVASNNAYADIARQIGGAAVTVLVADSRGDQTSMVRPQSIILCGWAPADDALRDAARRASPSATLIEPPRHASEETVSTAVPWYDAESMFALAHAYADHLMRVRPDLALQFAGNLAHMRAGFDAIAHKVQEIARDYANSEVITADPLSRHVANRLGFKAAGPAAAEDSGGAISAKSFNVLERELESREGSIFLYDRDVANPEMKKLVSLAAKSGVPPAGLQDKLPSGLQYQQWALRQWNTVHGALNEAAP